MNERKKETIKMYLKIGLAILTVIGFIFMIDQIWKTENFRTWTMWRMVVAVIFGILAYCYSVILGIGGVYFGILLRKDNYGEKMNTCIVVSVEGLAVIFQLVFWGALRSNYILCIVAGGVAVIIAIFYVRALLTMKD